jgi:glucosamine 6-phosphate synthetase-like amidotransferase/phosphosugar isomerase protein
VPHRLARMCGIVAYAGGRSALEVVLGGLRRLEHLGYDSAGVAVLVDGGLAAAKKAGTFADVQRELTERPLPAGTTGIGHTRRATHGPATDANAHPHLDNSGRVAVVQNGTIDDFADLRAELARRGHELASETDTEAAAHLLAEHFSSCGDLAESMRQVCRRLTGSFALVAVHADEPEVVVGACRGRPLVIGIGDGEGFLASDAAVFVTHTREAADVGADHVVTLQRDGAWVTDLDGVPVDVPTYRVDASTAGSGDEAGASTGGGSR